MSSDPDFDILRIKNVLRQKQDSRFTAQSHDWIVQAQKRQYSYNFDWLGLPIIQYPQDIIAMQELIWRLQPDLIIETGVARGGSVIFYASLLELIHKCGGPNGEVQAIDIDIRDNNRKAITTHPLSDRISLVEGSSISDEVLRKTRKKVFGKKSVLVCLDSNHTHEHVLKELENYSEFVSKNSYIVIFDTLIEDLPDDAIGERPWGKGNSPMSSVNEFLSHSNEFVVDESIHDKLQITTARNGFLKRVR